MKQNTLKSKKEVKAFIEFVSEELEKLNQIDDIDGSMSVEEIGQEVLARKLAHKKLSDILEPLIGTDEGSKGFNSKEYIV